MEGRKLIVARYIGEDGNKDNVIAEISKEYNGKYFVVYNPKTSPCNGGYWKTLEDAEKIVNRLRPTAKKLNSICIDCKTDCNGTCKQFWSGCIYRKTK